MSKKKVTKHQIRTEDNASCISRYPASWTYDLLILIPALTAYSMYRYHQPLIMSLFISTIITIPLTLMYGVITGIVPWRRIKAVYDCGDHLLVKCRDLDYRIRTSDIYAVEYVWGYRRPDFVKVILKRESEAAQHFVHTLDDYFIFYPYNYAGWPMLDFAAWLHSEAERSRSTLNPFRKAK